MSFHLSEVHLSVVRLQDQWGADTKARSKKNLSFTQKVVDKSQAVGLLLDVDGTFLRCFSVGSPRNRELEMAKNLHFFQQQIAPPKGQADLPELTSMLSCTQGK